jgi:dienelactone hydrolase
MNLLVRFVLHHLGAIRHAGTLDLRRIGAFGHSAGGSAIETAMLDEPRIDAGAAFEGSVRPWRFSSSAAGCCASSTAT